MRNIPLWLKISSEGDYSPCDGRFIFILISKRHPVNQIALCADDTQAARLQPGREDGNGGSMFLCHEMICSG